MSKMADIAQQLDEQCVDYGFTSYIEALEQGFTYEVAEDGTATLTPPSNGLEMAHEAWLKEKENILGYVYEAMTLIEALHNVGQYQREDQLKTLEQAYRRLEKVYKFIEGIKHD